MDPDEVVAQRISFDLKRAVEELDTDYPNRAFGILDMAARQKVPGAAERLARIWLQETPLGDYFRHRTRATIIFDWLDPESRLADRIRY